MNKNNWLLIWATPLGYVNNYVWVLLYQFVPDMHHPWCHAFNIIHFFVIRYLFPTDYFQYQAFFLMWLYALNWRKKCHLISTSPTWGNKLWSFPVRSWRTKMSQTWQVLFSHSSLSSLYLLVSDCNYNLWDFPQLS